MAEVLIREFISRIGVPLILHSDQGRNFESAVFSEMCKLRVTKIRIHPQSDSMMECFNRTLEAQLSKFVEDHRQDRDLLLPLLLMACRTAVYEGTGCTLASLMLGRDLRLPIDLLFRRPEVLEFARTNLKVASDGRKEM